MFKKFALGSFVALTMVTTGYAAEYEDGWKLSFKRDAFDKTVFPEASIYEEGSSISSSASLAVACDKNGKLVPTFGAPSPYLNPQTYQVEFRSGASQRKFLFKVGDVPRRGNQLRLQGEEATAFLELFANAAEPVAYRTEKEQGIFTSIAARQVFDIVRTSCPK